MRWLMTAVIGMGILIVAGVAVLVVLLVQRMSSVSAPIASASSATAASAGPATLDEPAGTRIVSASLGGDRVAVVLGGGGPDRVVIVDMRSGHVVGRVGLVR